MNEPKKLLIPLLNANESDAVVAALHVKEGQKIKVGDLLYTLETTKSTSEVIAKDGGYLVGISVAEGGLVSAGELFAYLADSPDWKIPAPQVSRKGGKAKTPTGLRITNPALRLAEENNLDLRVLPKDKMVTESMVIAHMQNIAGTAEETFENPESNGPSSIIVFGGGGHGKSVIDLLKSLKIYKILGVVDDQLSVGDEILGVSVIGNSGNLTPFHQDGIRLAVNAVGGIGNISSRIKVFSLLAEVGFSCPDIVHPTAFVETSAELSSGVQVFPHAYVGSDVKVGFGSIVNTGAIVSHDCQLGKTVNISPGAILAGGVTVGNGALVGMGVTVNLTVTIGESAQVGNSAVIKSDVKAGGIVRAGATH
ncbi:MAG: biotin/lipoyl-binding protein [Chloroflexota bacterium]